jgi:hypothetical protein
VPQLCINVTRYTGPRYNSSATEHIADDLCGAACCWDYSSDNHARERSPWVKQGAGGRKRPGSVVASTQCGNPNQSLASHWSTVISLRRHGSPADSRADSLATGRFARSAWIAGLVGQIQYRENCIADLSLQRMPQVHLEIRYSGGSTVLLKKKIQNSAFLK